MAEDMALPPQDVASHLAWWRCTASTDRRFTAGAAYEVLEYTARGRPIIATDIGRSLAKLPVSLATFEPHDPWATYRAARAIETSGSVRQDAPIPGEDQ